MAIYVGFDYGLPPAASQIPGYTVAYARDQGLAGYAQGYADGVASVETDLDPPEVELLSPIGGFAGDRLVARDTPVTIRVTDAVPGLRHVMILVSYTGSPHIFVAYDSSRGAEPGDGFAAEFQSSKRDVVEVSDTQVDVTVWPTGGWPGDPYLRVVAYDQAGNVEVDT